VSTEETNTLNANKLALKKERYSISSKVFVGAFVFCIIGLKHENKINAKNVVTAGIASFMQACVAYVIHAELYNCHI